jgi:phosphoglucomutase
LSTAPGDDNPIGGIKVITKDGWFAARPSGTEEIYKMYAQASSGQIICGVSRMKPRPLFGRAQA